MSVSLLVKKLAAEKKNAAKFCHHKIYFNFVDHCSVIFVT